jgi:hypothetical protein
VLGRLAVGLLQQTYGIVVIVADGELSQPCSADHVGRGDAREDDETRDIYHGPLIICEVEQLLGAPPELLRLAHPRCAYGWATSL